MAESSHNGEIRSLTEDELMQFVGDVTGRKLRKKDIIGSREDSESDNVKVIMKVRLNNRHLKVMRKIQIEKTTFPYLI